MIDLSITIVNYNTKDLLRQCIKSIYETIKNISFEIIVADNASSDGSVEMLKNEFPEVYPAPIPGQSVIDDKDTSRSYCNSETSTDVSFVNRSGVKVIANKENLFFTKAHNQALKVATGRYLMILNSDTIISDGAFDKMAQFMDEHPECGACGPKLLNPDRTLQRSSDRLPTFFYGLLEVLLLNTVFPNNPIKKWRIYADWDRNSTKEVDSVGGSCMMIRKEVAEKVGLLDENFLAYWEEIDWCKRILEAGYKIYYLAQAQIIHYWQVAMDTLGKEKKEKIFYDSMFYYYRKHFGLFAFVILWLILNFYTKPVLKLVRTIKSIL